MELGLAIEQARTFGRLRSSLTVKSGPLAAGLDHKAWFVLHGLDQPPGCQAAHPPACMGKAPSCRSRHLGQQPTGLHLVFAYSHNLLLHASQGVTSCGTLAVQGGMKEKTTFIVFSGS